MISLTEQQKQAVEFLSGMAVVIAVPGSGKTYTMTQRINHLVESGIAPENILGLTFTRNAAQAMREKLVTVLNGNADRVQLSTIHSFCFWLLKSQGRVFNILTGKDQLIFLKKIIDKRKIKDLSVGMALSEIRLAKNNCFTASEYAELAGDDPMMTRIGLVFETYEAEKGKKLMLDFEDLLIEACCLFRENKETKEKFQSHFPHVLVDEYQDTNPLQLELIKLLVENRNGSSSFWACGDDWQSIYAFTGASVGNIVNFGKLFPDSQQFVLSLNFRSTKEILRACHKLIRNNTRQIEKDLLTNNCEGTPPIVIESLDEQQEALVVANEVQSLVENEQFNYDDIAILYRANFQSMILEEAFSKAKVPYQIQNGMSFYERREVAWLISYLKLLNDPESEIGNEAVRHVLNVPNRYISRKFMQDLETFARQKSMFLFQSLTEMPIDVPFTRKNVKAWIKFLELLMARGDDIGPAEAIKTIRDSLDYDRFITDEDIPAPDDQKIQNVNQLHLSAARFDTISEFLAHVEQFQDSAPKEANSGVQLMTIHKAKGLEFPVVFVVGLVENILPSRKGNIEEERRICFVAISRAMERLYLCTSNVYLGQTAKRSQFLDEMLAKTH
jgi:DNA helicase II / ATP-dependent DNA helicase PcrA